MMKAILSNWMLIWLFVTLFAVENAGAFSSSHAFAASTRAAARASPYYRHVLKSSEEDESSETTDTKKSLEEKMSKWEATDEEKKAATLGGVVPSSDGRSDAFDVGLYVAFPFMVIASLAFAFFPFIMDKIDVSSVGPPPTV